MITLYTFALVVGVGMYLFSIFSDAHHHVDVGGAHGLDHHHDSDTFQILSMRNATYFLFAFGVTGVLLRWLWGGERGLLTAILATSVGLAGGAISSLTFGWLRKTESGGLPTDRSWVGLPGRVTIPITSGGTGKILVTRGGHEQELLARPFEPGAKGAERWTDVTVMEMQSGIALVAPGHVSDEGSLLPPPSDS
jgi:hypothetical protein